LPLEPFVASGRVKVNVKPLRKTEKDDREWTKGNNQPGIKRYTIIKRPARKLKLKLTTRGFVVKKITRGGFLKGELISKSRIRTWFGEVDK